MYAHAAMQRYPHYPPAQYPASELFELLACYLAQKQAQTCMLSHACTAARALWQCSSCRALAEMACFSADIVLKGEAVVYNLQL